MVFGYIHVCGELVNDGSLSWGTGGGGRVKVYVDNAMLQGGKESERVRRVWVVLGRLSPQHDGNIHTRANLGAFTAKPRRATS